MKMVYYYVDTDGQTRGPVGLDFFKVNHINAHSWVWHDGMPQWVEVHTVPSLRKYMRSDIAASFSTKKGIVDYDTERTKVPALAGISVSELDLLRSRVPKTWLTESILITLFCCVPLGIVSIIYASRVAPYWRRGLYGESLAASSAAAMWVKLTLMVTIAIWVVYTVIWIFTPVADNFLLWYNNYFTTGL